MQDRRTFLGLAAALLPIGPMDAVAQTPARQPASELARYALTGQFEGFDAVLVQLNFTPGQGATGPGHKHPGPVLGYVLEGQLRFGINHEAERVIPAGGTFFEATGAVHTTNGSARPDGPTRAIVFMLVPKGAPLTAPE